MSKEPFFCYFVEKGPDGEVKTSIAEKSIDDLPEGEVLIRVSYSSLNFKDAMAAAGRPGVAKKYPHIPGIDAAGVVVESRSDDFAPGDEVLATSYELGAGQWGGWSQYVRVPAEWVVSLPKGLSLRESMILGTAGLTAAMCVEALQQHDITPEMGEIVVTGASGGVGCLAVNLLAHLGYKVAAVTGKESLRETILGWGASRVISREEVVDSSERPLLKSAWAGGVDGVGGNMLATILRQMNARGCVAAYGLVGGVNLPISVLPFILRGVTLAGIDSANYPRARRVELWRRLGSQWRIKNLNELAASFNLDQLSQCVQLMLRGEMQGRTLVEPVRE